MVAVLLTSCTSSATTEGSLPAGPPIATTTSAAATSRPPSTPPLVIAAPDRKKVYDPQYDPYYLEVIHSGHKLIEAGVDDIASRKEAVIDPPIWGRAVFWTSSVQPQYPSKGTSIMYGHTCIHHTCPFTRLNLAVPGDTAVVQSLKGSFTYRIDAVVHQPKARMPHFNFGHYDAALVSCILPGEGSHEDNRIVLGTLISATAGPSGAG